MVMGDADRNRRAGLKSNWIAAACGVPRALKEDRGTGIIGVVPKPHDVGLELRPPAAIVAFSGDAIIINRRTLLNLRIGSYK